MHISQQILDPYLICIKGKVKNVTAMENEDLSLKQNLKDYWFCWGSLRGSTYRKKRMIYNTYIGYNSFYARTIYDVVAYIDIIQCFMGQSWNKHYINASISNAVVHLTGHIGNSLRSRRNTYGNLQVSFPNFQKILKDICAIPFNQNFRFMKICINWER